MFADLGKTYNETITVVNKLDARDSATRQDTYYTTVIDHCMWTVKSHRTVEADGTVVLATVNQVQIPESENYLPYREWRKTENRAEAFTIRNGDYLIKGEVEDEITAANVKQVVKLYEPDAFQVQTFRDATKGDGFSHSTDGVMRFTEVYVIEG